MKKVNVSRSDASAYLDSEEAVAAYLDAAREEDDAELLVAAIADVAKARGMARNFSPVVYRHASHLPE